MAKTIAKGRSDRIAEITFDSQRIKADGRSSCEVRIRLHPGDSAPLALRITAGSFERDRTMRETTLIPVNGLITFRIFAPRIPKSGFLLAEGLKAPLQFSPASFTHYLAFDLVPTLFFAIIFALIIRSFAVASFYIPSGSMEPTLLEHDRLIADRFSYTFRVRQPERGDVVIFRFPENPRIDYIKRTIGLPGDKVAIHDGEVFVNGKPLTEGYVAEPPYYEMDEVEIPEGHYFMLGDNRNSSRDSHIWGFVPAKYLVGEALFIYWPVQRARVLHNPFQVE